MDSGLAAMKLVLVLCLLLIVAPACSASAGDRHPHFRSCIERCEKDGTVNELQLPSCGVMNRGVNIDCQTSLKSAFLLLLDNWDCKSECRYQCMKDTESQQGNVAEAPMKYYGKWPFDRYLNLQEPASVIFSVLNILAHLRGVWYFFYLARFRLQRPPLPVGGKYPEFTRLWILYAAFAVNSWIWSAVFHARDVTITERLDYSSAVALLGYSLVLTLIRTGNLTVEAPQVLVAAPIIAFTSTHIMYLNFYNFDYGLNMKVCVTIGITQLLLWTGWAGITHHPSRFKLWFVVLGTTLAMLLEIFDFPPFWGVLDAHALWHACTLPITVLWWNFIREDLKMRTASQQRIAERAARKVE